MRSTLMIFIDGVGIGKQDCENNPFFKFGFKTFSELLGEIPHIGRKRLRRNNRFLFPVDATMGVEGLPLSGTGQTSIFCGVNAPKIIGKHFGPYPYSTLVPILKEKNIFREFKLKKMKVEFVNAYPKAFFKYVNSGRKMLSVTTLSCLQSSVRLNNITDLNRGRALSPDITNQRLNERFDNKTKVIKPELAAKRLIRIASKNHFTCFETFQTDHLGHGRNGEQLENFTKILDSFLYYIITHLTDNMTLVICSDHGNFEDISVKMHTLNPAIGMTAGKDAEYLAKRIKKLYDIKPAIMELYE